MDKLEELKTFLIPVGFLLLWIIISSFIAGSECPDLEAIKPSMKSMANFVAERCVEAKERNSSVVDVVFGFLFAVSVVVTGVYYYFRRVNRPY